MSYATISKTPLIEDITIKSGPISIIGNGAWGSALASLLSTSYIGPDVIIMAIPTNVMREVLGKIHDQISDKTIIINGSKGIEKTTHKLPHEIATEVLGDNINYFSLVGPSFAEGIIQKHPTIVNLGYKDRKYLSYAQSVFQSEHLEIVPTRCLHAIEIMGAFKNVYAIGCGIAEGLGYGENTRTKLILTAQEELKQLLKNTGHEYTQSAQIAFLGDLILTCSSTKSRNFSFGKLIVRHSIPKCQQIIGQTTEGLHSIKSIEHFERQTGIKLSLASMIDSIIKADRYNDKKRVFDDFILKRR